MSTRPQRRVVIVDDHTLFREGLRTILEMEEGIEVVADAESAEDIVELVWQTKPDVLLLDIRMPQGSGLDAVPAVLRISPRTQVLVLTACDEKEEHVRAFKLGAKGALAVTDGRLHREPAVAVRAVDPVGAGDAFVAGYLAGLLDGCAGPECVRIGTRCGAFAVTVSGDWEGMPTREELDLLRHGDGTVLR